MEPKAKLVQKALAEMNEKNYGATPFQPDENYFHSTPLEIQEFMMWMFSVMNMITWVLQTLFANIFFIQAAVV